MHAEVISKCKVALWVCMDYECSLTPPNVSGNTERKFFSFCNLRIGILVSVVECANTDILNTFKSRKNYIQWHLTTILKYQTWDSWRVLWNLFHYCSFSCELILFFFSFLSLAGMIKLKKKIAALYIIWTICVNVSFKLEFLCKVGSRIKWPFHIPTSKSISSVLSLAYTFPWPVLKDQDITVTLSICQCCTKCFKYLVNNNFINNQCLWAYCMSGPLPSTLHRLSQVVITASCDRKILRVSQDSQRLVHTYLLPVV